jgi:fructan beta-fructosidase
MAPRGCATRGSWAHRAAQRVVLDGRRERGRTTRWVVAPLLALGLMLVPLGSSGPGHESSRAQEAERARNEPLRPQYHFTPLRNWMNDPNGPVWLDGEYHLFYQYNPNGDTWGDISWGHAVSPDLVHWEELDVAIPAADGRLVFSGSAADDPDARTGLCPSGVPCLIAVYTAYVVDPATQLPIQRQELSWSSDRGRTWSAYEGNPVLDLGLADFRDPNIFWHQPSDQWIMPVALATERVIAFFGSPNLREWQPLGRFGPAGGIDGIWECPALMELPVDGGAGGTRWLLKVDVNPGHVAGGSGGQYFIGDFDGWTFTATEPGPGSEPLWVDHGRDFYCALQWSSEPAHPDGRTWIAWMNDWTYAELVPTAPWRGAMTIPRRVSLVSTADGTRLRQVPIAELASLRGRALEVSGSDPAVLTRQLAELAPDGLDRSLELALSIRPGSAEAVRLGIGFGEGSRANLTWHVDRAELRLDRRRSGRVDFHPAFPGVDRVPVPSDALDPDGSLRLRVFLDRSSVEVFGGDGRLAITGQVFPKAGRTSLGLTAAGGEVERIDLLAWELASAWPSSDPAS